MFDLESSIKKALPAALAGLLACAGAAAGQNREPGGCDAAHANCHKVIILPKPGASATPAAPAPTSLPADKAGDVPMGIAMTTALAEPPSLAAAAMPPNVSTTHAEAPIPASAHADCAKRKHGSKISVRLGPNETIAGICQRDSKHGGKMQFRARR